jgi:integrase
MLARSRASKVVQQWRDEFEEVRAEKSGRGEQWKEELQAQVVAQQSQLQAVMQRIFSNTPSTNDGTPTNLDWVHQIPPMVEVLCNHGMAKEANAFAVAVRQFLDFYDIQNPTKLQAADAAQRVQTAFDSITAAMLIKDYELTPSEEVEAHTIISNPATYRPKSPYSASTIKAFTTHLLSQNDNPRTTSIYTSQIQAFSAYLTSEGVVLNFDTVAAYLDTVSQNAQTRKGHLTPLRKIHKWACKYVPAYRDQFAALASPFDGHEHARVGKEGGRHWTPYTKQEVVTLRNAALANQDNELADLITFAGLTGCRLEEIGRISQATTILDSAGNPVAFSILESKTRAGVREVPIHHQLLPLYLQRLATSTENDGFLFKAGASTKGFRLSAPGQRFSKLKRKLGFDDLHCFHSFRGTFNGELVVAGVRMEILPYLIGHKTGSITLDIYSRGPSMTQKTEAINLLSYNFD